MQKRSLIGFLLALLSFSCSTRDGKEFAAPEVLSSDAIVEGAEGELRCTLSHGRVDHCGFILDGEMMEGILADNIFTAKLSGLEMNHTYNWEAFARAGNSEVRSSGQSFTAPEGAVPIPDPVFKAYLLKNFDRDADGVISPYEAQWITEISVETDQIASLQGIEYMPHVRILNVWGSEPEKGGLTELDVSRNPELRGLFCINNRIRSLDLSRNSLLERLSCWENQLTELDVSHNPLLKEIACAQNALTQLDISHNPQLTQLHFNDTHISSIDLSAHPLIQRISCWNTPLTQLDVSLCPRLQRLDAYRCLLSSFTLSDMQELCWLDVSDNPISSISISNCPEISSLKLNNLQLSFDELPDLTQWSLRELHLSSVAHQMPSDYLRNFPLLTGLNCCGFEGTTLDLSQNTCLRYVWCVDMKNITTLDFSLAPDLKWLYMTGCAELTTVYLAEGTQLEILEKDAHTQIVYGKPGS